MTTKEAKEILDGFFSKGEPEYEALQKLISITEQVEGVRGIEDKHLKMGTDSVERCDSSTDYDTGFNAANSLWRALIVGVFQRREEEIKKLYHPTSDVYNSAMVNLQYYRNLFLGGGE